MSTDPKGSKRVRSGLVRHLCRAMIVDFRAVDATEAARMLREHPDGEARAKVVEQLTATEWSQVLVRVADALKPGLRGAFLAEKVEEVLHAEIDASGRAKTSRKREESKVAPRRK